MKKIIFRMAIATIVYFSVGFVLLKAREFLISNIKTDLLILAIICLAIVLGWLTAKKIFAELVGAESSFYKAAKHTLSIISGIAMLAVVDPLDYFPGNILEFFVALIGFMFFIFLILIFADLVVSKIFGKKIEKR